MSIVPALISAGSGILSSVGTAIQGHRNRKFAREMLQRQMDYQDKVNEQQMDFTREINEYNSPANQRARLEEAGYNPFLREVNAGNGVSSSLGASVSPPSATEGNMFEGVSQAAQSFSGIYKDLQSVRGVAVENEAKRYALDKEKANDDVTDKDGRRAYHADGLRKLADVQEAQSRANISAIESFVAEVTKNWQMAEATDANGETLTDSDGNPISNLAAGKNVELKNAQRCLEKLVTDISKGNVEWENLSVDNLLKRYDLQYMKPVELENLRGQLVHLKSQINLNAASARSALSSAALAEENAATTRGLRPWQVSNEKNAAGNRFMDYRIGQARLMQMKSDYSASDAVNRGDAAFNNSLFGQYAMPVFRGLGGVVGTALGGAVGYGVGAYNNFHQSSPATFPSYGSASSGSYTVKPETPKKKSFVQRIIRRK